jgi:hypothetical protein
VKKVAHLLRLILCLLVVLVLLIMGAKPTRSSVSENLNSIVSKTFLTFTVNCQKQAENSQEVFVESRNVTWTSPNGPVVFQSNAGCVACQGAMGRLLANYLLARESFPETQDGDSTKILSNQAAICSMMCTDVFVTNVSQDSYLQFFGSCSVTQNTLGQFVNECTANIMQSLQSDSDFFSAVANAFGGGSNLEVRNKIQNSIQQNLTLDITNDMNASIVANQAFTVSASNSVYSSGISQQLMLDCTVTVLVQHDFANKVLQNTSIDQYTKVENDENTVKAALDAIEQVNRAFTKAITTNTALFGVFIAVLVLSGTILLVAIVLQANADSMKRQLAAYCNDKTLGPSTTTLAGSLGGKTFEVKLPTVTV